MGIIEFKNMSFAYAGSEKKVLNNISFDVKHSEFVLIIGSSGSGKTTIIRHMKKNMFPEGKLTGNILYCNDTLQDLNDRRSASEIGYVGQDPDNQIVTDKVWHELAFGLENLGLDNKQIRNRTAEMAEYFGITDWYHKDVSQLSGGQKQLLNLASVMVMQPEVLLLDEPTAQLDPIAADRFLETVVKINQELGTTVIITEHRTENIFGISDRVIALDSGEIIGNSTPEDVAVKLKNEGSQLYIGLPSAMRIFYGTCAEGNNIPLTTKEGRLWIRKVLQDKIVDNNRENYKEGYKENDNRNYKDKNDKNYTITASSISFSYSKKEEVLNNLNLEIKTGEITAVMGGNGAGKSTLLKLLAGIKKPDSGKIKARGKIVMLPQNPMSIFTEISVEEELAEVVMTSGEEKAGSTADKIARVNNMLTLMDLENVRKQHPFDLSGGQQQKLALGKVLLCKPDVLLLDEPTKGLDPYFKQSMGEQLRKLKESDITIVMVSHDVEFCAEFADNCCLLFDGDIITSQKSKEFFMGNRFYTTQTNRIMSEYSPECVTCNDAVSAINSCL